MIGVAVVLFLYSSRAFVHLENEECQSRPSLFRLGALNFPQVVELFKCDGSCGWDNGRKCDVLTKVQLHIHTLNLVSNKSEIFVLGNETLCTCGCVYNKSVCDEAWDDRTCKCKCGLKSCSQNYQWNPRFCKCECDRSCPRRMYLNRTSCMCRCKEKIYRRCAKRGQIVDKTCYCMISDWVAREHESSKLKTISILLILWCIIVIIFDCVLCLKNWGCLYTIFRIRRTQ